MIRSCIVCRKKGSDLFSLFLDSEKQIILGRSPQRQYWICKSKVCIQNLGQTKKQPKPLRSRNITCNSLLLQVQKQINRNIEKNLMFSLNSGAVCSGSYEILQKKGKLLCIVTSSDKIKERWIQKKIKPPIFSLNVSTRELGAKIRKGPRSSIGIFPNSHSILLAENLHLLEKLR